MSLNNIFYLIYLAVISAIYYVLLMSKKEKLLSKILILIIISSYIFTYIGFAIDCPDGYKCGSVSFSTFLFLNVLPTSLLLNYLVIKIQEKKTLEFVGFSLVSSFAVIFIYLIYGVLYSLVFSSYIGFSNFYVYATPVIFLISLVIMVFLPIKSFINYNKSLKKGSKSSK
jgi:hypothetical protein